MAETVSELKRLWEKVLENLQQKIDDRRLFEAFLQESKLYSFEDKQAIVGVNSDLAATILTSKYLGAVSESLKEITGIAVKVKFENSKNLTTTSPVQKAEDEIKFYKYSIVNPSLTFDTFITGPCNIEAKQAALLIAGQPGKFFNPLFIYSDSGLGKTHLLFAIANKLKEDGEGKKALYVSAQDFIEEFIIYTSGKYAGVSKDADVLKKYICSFDMLLIDDVQQLGGKQGVEGFLFEIFQKFYNTGKQIVITSDKHPSELKGFEERLITRFSAGLTLSMSSPDVATCVSILKSKINNTATLDITAFDEDVLVFIAEKFSKNLRTIEEALHKLVFYTMSYQTKHIDMEVALDALQPLLDVRMEKQRLNEQRIINVVADYYKNSGITANDITGTSRRADIAKARHISMYLIRTLLDTPFTKIGLLFGGKDHSTVMNGVEKVEKELKTNTALQAAINDLKRMLKS